MVRVAGLVGHTAQAVREAETALALGYDCGLLSLAAYRGAGDDEILAHCRAVAEVIPLFGFYLQPAVGGRVLSYAFWRNFAEIESVVAIKIAPFNRYQTLDVVRAVVDAGRDRGDRALHGQRRPYRGGSGCPLPARPADAPAIRIVGGLLGHWAVWTRGAVALLERCRASWARGVIPTDLLATGLR